MKRLAALFFALVICCVAIPAAAWQETVMWNDVSYLVDTEACTISDGRYTYEYLLTPYGDGGGYDLDITYPNGAEYRWMDIGGGYFEWSEDYDDSGSLYLKGDHLKGILEQAGVLPGSRSLPWEGKSVPLLLLLLAIGLAGLLAPRAVWYLEIGWRIQDAEPTKAALVVNRVIGGLFLFGVLIWFFIL